MEWNRPATTADRLCEGLPGLHRAAAAVLPVKRCGFLRCDGELAILTFADALGVRVHSVGAGQLPPALQPRASGLTRLIAADPAANPDGVAETCLLRGGLPGGLHEPFAAHQVFVLPIPGADPPVLLTCGVDDDAPLGPQQMEQMQSIARAAADLVAREEPPQVEIDRLRRLKAIDALLPALFRVLDVREIFDRVSAMTRDILPHDILGLGLFSDDGRQVSMYAHTSAQPFTHPMANAYPAAVTGSWLGHIVDDLTVHPIERESEAARRGGRSSLSVAIRFDDRLIGGLAFYSREPARYGTADMVIGERIAEFVGLALAHQRLADEARRAEALRERTVNLATLDDLLKTLAGVLDVREVFDRVSEIAQQVLPHDAMAIREMTADINRVRNYALSGFGDVPFPAESPANQPELLNEPWDFQIIDDMSADPRYSGLLPVKIGLLAALSLPVRLEGRLRASINFFSRTRGRFTREDVLIGRRITDHIALTYSHQRLAEESQRAAALQERAANLDMLEGLLKTLAEVLDIRQVFDRVSDISSRVMTHDAMTITVPRPDLEHLTVHAATGALDHLPIPFDIAVPDRRLLAEDLDFELINELQDHPMYRGTPSVKAGLEAMLSIPVRVEGSLQAFVNFFSRTRGHFTRDDVMVGRRIADHVALALSHQRLAEKERRNEELRAKSANLELLDELLATLADGGELHETFDRISNIARKVVPHDALVLPVFLPDGIHAKRYVSSGVDSATLPEIVEVPQALRDPEWEYDLIDDLTTGSAAAQVELVKKGFRSAMRVPVRLGGRMVAGLVFISRSASAYRQDDVPAARRVADRIALSLSRERTVDAMRRADEAATRALQLESRVKALTEELDARTGYRRVVGQSAEWRQVLTEATQVAATETTALLLGESGTGKEVVARFIHRASARSSGPFVALNCAALPEQLLEAELFGYERGAFTGATQSKPGQLEQASGGTLFLDEVGEMSPTAQAKFLRVLQEREFQRLGGTRVLRTDARIVAATNRDLKRAIAQGQFREDLYYRLHVFAIQLPPLRDRPDDILPLSEAFVAEIGRGLGRPPSGISRDAKSRLVEYQWPGNVRELRNILERAAILCEGGLITAAHLAVTVPDATSRPERQAVTVPDTARSASAPSAVPPTILTGDLKSMERTMIERALQNARFNKSKAAKELGLTRAQLYVRMKRYGLE